MRGNETEVSLPGHFISVTDSEKWNAALDSVAKPDVYFTAGYHLLSEIDSGRRAVAYHQEARGETLFYPFLIGAIPGLSTDEKFYDIESCYGYGGPLSTTTDSQILQELWAPYLEWVQEQGVVAEVVRFHPLLETQRHAVPGMNTLLNRSTVSLDLSGGVEQVWANYPAKQRNQIRQAERNGLTCRVGNAGEIQDVFLPVYEQAMVHVQAGERYYFNKNYFSYLKEHFAEACDLLIVEKGTQVLAAALFLKGTDIYHYHLSGSLPDARIYRPNNLLLHEAVKRAVELAFSKMHFGGGRTAAPDDALFKFKASFSDQLADFYIGEKIYRPDVYEKIGEAWLREAGQSNRPGALLFYRLPLPSPS